MASYMRLSDAAGSPTEQEVEHGFSPPFQSEYERPYLQEQWAKFRRRCKRWWKMTVLGEEEEAQVPSGYLTLIPLNDSRLKPRRTYLLVILLLTFAVAVASATYFLVPRGISAGEIDIQSDHMSWNTSKGTYELNLLARIPIYNPNFLNAKVEGVLKVYFFDTEAGAKNISNTRILARSNPQVLEIDVDASNVPSKYALTILSECAAFPRRLIFFLKGSLTVTTGLGSQQKLSNFDTYCMVSCSGGDIIGDNFASEPGGEHAAPFSLASDREA